MRRSKGAPLIGYVITKIPTWGYHQLVIFTPSRIPIMVPNGGNGEQPLDLNPKWTISPKEIKRSIGKIFQTSPFLTTTPMSYPYIFLVHMECNKTYYYYKNVCN
jgi:hypothetical protein